MKWIQRKDVAPGSQWKILGSDATWVAERNWNPMRRGWVRMRSEDRRIRFSPHMWAAVKRSGAVSRSAGGGIK